MSVINLGANVSNADRSWHIVGRWQEYEGEARANLLRVIGIAAFYAIELINYHGLNLGFLNLARRPDVTTEFHRIVTLLSVVWTLLALGVHLSLSRQFFPGALKFVSTGVDIVLLTTILIVADGPRSPLVIGYFLLILLTGLRFNLTLVRCATIGAIAGYLFVCGHARWFAVRDVRVPRSNQLTVLVALALTGIVLGQIVSRVRGLAEDYARRAGSSPPGGTSA